jgi:hypothetical protein
VFTLRYRLKCNAGSFLSQGLIPSDSDTGVQPPVIHYVVSDVKTAFSSEIELKSRTLNIFQDHFGS